MAAFVRAYSSFFQISLTCHVSSKIFESHCFRTVSLQRFGSLESLLETIRGTGGSICSALELSRARTRTPRCGPNEHCGRSV